MSRLSDYPVTRRWPPQHPDRLQLYSSPTPNGVKISIALEELGVPYEVHRLELSRNETRDAEFVALNPNARIPAILDPDGPGGAPLTLWESGAILVYLAEKTGRLMSPDTATRHQTLQWIFFQVSAVGPNFGQLGYFHKHAGRSIEDKRPRDRFVAEAKRVLGVLNAALEGRDWLVGADAGEYSIADIATLGWVRALVTSYDAGDLVGMNNFTGLNAWLERGLARPAVQRGLVIPGVTATANRPAGFGGWPRGH